jgi:hypothetical protein
MECYGNPEPFIEKVGEKPQSELEQAEITAMAPMDDGDPSWLSPQGTKIDDPDRRETGSNEQARQTLWIGQRRCGEIASATFRIGEKGFDPQSLGIEVTRVFC